MNSNKTIVTLMLIALVSFMVTGCSDDSTTAAPAIDTTPPLAPIGFDGSYDSATQACYLSWDVNTVDSDLAGYIIKVEVLGLETVLEASPVQLNNYIHANPVVGEAAIYKVYSVDYSGNESAAANLTLLPTIGSRFDTIEN